MAATFTWSPYSNVTFTVTYTSSKTDTQSTIRFNRIDFKCTNTNGLNTAKSVFFYNAENLNMLLNPWNLPKGTKTKSYTWSNAVLTVNRTHADQTVDYLIEFLEESDWATGPTHYWHWIVPQKPSYTVSYAANGGSSTPGSQTKWYGENLGLSGAIARTATSPGNYTVTLNGNGAANPTALTSKRTTSYSFAGWKANNGTVYSAGGTYQANESTTMTAQWTSSESRAAVTLPSITRSGYSWVRWNTNNVNTGTGYSNGASYTPSGNVTLYAIWNRTVTFNANGGSGAPGAQTALATSAITLSSTQPTLSGYSFNRWNTKTDNTGTGYAPGGSYAAQNPSVTLYAIWNRTVSYNANGGSGAPGAQTSVKTSAITLSSTKPTREGYVFKGWAISADGAVAYQAGGTYAANNPTRTLHAVWAPAASITAVTRTDSQGNADVLGGYVKVDFTVSNQSSCTVSVAATGQTFSATPTQSGSVILGDGSLSKLNPETAYTVTVTAYGGTDANGSNAVSYTLAKSAYTRPSITTISAERVEWNTRTSQFVPSDEGTFMRLTVGWATYSTPSQVASMSVLAVCEDGSTVDLSTCQPSIPSGTHSGDSMYYLPATGGSSGLFNTEKNYSVSVTLTDVMYEATHSAAYSSTMGDTLASAFFTMDVLGDAYFFQLTSDTAAVSGKTYYVLNDGVYVEVAAENVTDITECYEKTGPRPGHGVSFGAPAVHEAFNIAMPPECYGEPCVPTFKTNSISNFVAPDGVDECIVMDTSNTQNNGLHHSNQMLSVPIGTILDFAGATMPVGYLECDGSAVSRTTYAALYAILGTTWGAGDGSTTFNLPNLGGKTCIGRGSRSVGNTGGSETHTLTTSEMPSHNHSVGAHHHSVGAHKHTVPQHGHGHNIGVNQHGAAGCTRTTNVGVSVSAHQMKFVYKKYPTNGSANQVMPTGSGTESSGTNLFTNNHSVSVTQPTFNTPALSHTVTGGVSDKAAFNTNDSTAFNTGDSTAFNSGNSGSGTAYSIMQPYAVVKKMIRAF